MATIVAAAGGGNWTTGATWVGGVVPTAADDVQLDATSGQVTINAAAVCRSLDCTGYTGTLTHTAAITLSIGDATAGTGNNALKFVAGMTYTLGNTSTSALSFISTSATQQTIDFGGKTTGNVTFDGVGGSWSLSSAMTTNSAATLTITRGTFNTNNQTCSWGKFVANSGNTKGITFGTSTITLSGSGSTQWDVNASGTTFSGASSTINCLQAQIGFTAGTGLTYGTVTFAGGGGVQLNSANTFTNLSRTGATNKTDTFYLSNNITVTGSLTLTGNSVTNRLHFFSNVVGTQRVITNTSTTMSFTNVDVMDIGLTVLYDASAATGGSGDGGGNTNITFTTSATQTATMSISKNWSDATIWSGRVPLPQDDVSLSGVTGGTLTADMPRAGRSISWVGATGTPTFGTSNINIYGSLTLISGMNVTGAGTINFCGRSTYTITSAGKTLPNQILFVNPSGTYTLQDDFICTSNFLHNNGTFNANGFNVTANAVNSTSGLTRALTMGSGTWFTTNTAATNNFIVTTGGLTFSGASATVSISTASTSTRIFQGAGLTYGSLTYTVAGSTGILQVTGSNTFTTINFSDATNARTLQFTAGTTTTVTNWNVVGTSGKLMSVQSITAATHTLTKPSGTVSTDYLALTNSIATGGAGWYAGANSTNSGGNTGWIFTVPPTVNPTAFFAMF